MQPFRDLGAAPPAVPAPPKARDVASWILADPDHLDDLGDDAQCLRGGRCGDTRWHAEHRGEVRLRP
jgi:hypothetical protein